MGRHKIQRQKLQDLRRRLENGETIKNRDIRAAFGKDDYRVYADKLREAREDNSQRKQVPERTDMQRRAEKAIKQYMMLVARNSVGGDAHDDWLENAQERLEELTPSELMDFNPTLYCYQPNTGALEFSIPAKGSKPTPIYRAVNPPQKIKEIKKLALAEAINEVLATRYEERNELEQAQARKLKAKLKELGKKRGY